MPDPTPDPSALPGSLARVRLAVLVGIAACGAVVVMQPGEVEQPLDRGITAAALGLGMLSIVARRVAALEATAARTAVSMALGGMLSALALGGLAVVVALQQSARETGLLLALGGFILALPRPILPSLATRSER